MRRQRINGPVEGVGYPAATPEDMEETVRQVEALGRRIVVGKQTFVTSMHSGEPSTRV